MSAQRGSRSIRAIGWYLCLVLTLLVIQRFAGSVFHGDPLVSGPDGMSAFFAKWIQFDGHRYLAIAQSGYAYDAASQSTIAWFPFYPICIRAGIALGLDPTISAVAVTLVSGAGSAYLYHRWLGLQGMTDSSATTAWLALMLYPYSWFLFGIVYSDALFLFLVLACLSLVEARRPVLAGLVAALASATRPVGVAVVVGAFVLNLERSGVFDHRADRDDTRRWPWSAHQFHRAAIRPTMFAPLLGFVGVGSYMAYLAREFGSPFAFVENQQTFRPGSPLMNLTGIRAIIDGWRSISVGAGLTILVLASAGFTLLFVLRKRMNNAQRGALIVVALLTTATAARWSDFVEFPAYRMTTAAQGLICLFAVVSLPAVTRRFGLGYAVHVAILVAIPTISLGDFMGAGRYLIAAFPVAALYGERLSTMQPRVRFAALATSGILMAMMSFGFVHGMYLS